MNKSTANAVTAVCMMCVTAMLCLGVAVLSAREVFWMLIRLDIIGR